MGENFRNQEPEIFRQEPSRYDLPGQVPIDIYARAIEGMIVVCADVIIVSRQSKLLYLAKRRHRPCADRWCQIGGRVNVREDLRSAATRKIKEELGLNISPERLEYLANIRFVWEERQQEPQVLPSDDLIYFYLLDATQREVETSNLNSESHYAELGLQPFDRTRLSTEPTHPLLVEIYDRVCGITLNP